MRWVAMKEKSPPEPGLYVASDGEEVQIMRYCGMYADAADWSSANCNTLDVTHWLEMRSWDFFPQDDDERSEETHQSS